jgi:hypothetical protein
MRRSLVLVAGLVVVSGCSLKDVFSGHQDVVATASGQELTVERVASMIAPAKSVPLRREIVDRIADMWVDYELLAQAVASGDSLLDSATVENASWPAVVSQLATAYHDSLVKPPAVKPAQVDSAYNGNDHRLVSHILVALRQDTSAASKAAKRRTVQGYLDQLHHGANFADLARRVSEDPGSKAQGGSVGIIRRGQMVKPFEDAAFALRPGETSPIVETAYGYHILYRPALDQVRDTFQTHLEDVFAERADSLFLDSLTNKTGVHVEARAPQMVKAAATNLRLAKSRDRTIATWRGGKLTERELATWLQAYPPQTIGMIGQAPDSTLNEFVKSLARNEMIIAAARARGFRVTPGARDTIRTRYRTDLMEIENGIGISPESLAADTAARGMDRKARAARHIEAYFTAITNAPGSRQLYMVPPYLSDVLRQRFSWKVNAAGVDRALERARTLRGPETPQAPPGMPQMTPAPGGPPVGQRGQPGQPGGPPLRNIR